MLERLLISIGLIVTAIIPYLVSVDNQRYLTALFNTNCQGIIGFSAERCLSISIPVSSFVLSCGILLLILKNKQIVYGYCALGLIIWAIFYVNPLVDKTYQNIKLAIEIGACIMGIFLLALRKNSDKVKSL